LTRTHNQNQPIYMSELKVTGIVKQVFPTERKGTFSYRMLWLTIDHTGQYPQTIEVQFAQNKAALLDNINAGDEITVDFNLRGRSWVSPTNEEKVFVTITGWRLTKGASAQPAPTQSGTFDPNMPVPGGAKDDLPF
jgi:hypothetical protein